MLALDPGVVYVHEPFNPDVRAPVMRVRPPFWFQYVTAENEADFVAPMQDVLRFRRPPRPRESDTILGRVGRSARLEVGSLARRLRGRRPLLKDPIALMSAEWLANRFGSRNVVLIRHPAAFASSLKRLDWTFDFGHWVGQPLLLRDLVGPYAAEIGSYAERERDIIDQAILLWNVMHHVILGYRERHPDWIFIRHEDLCEEPTDRFRELYDRLDLPWSPAIAATVRASSSEEGRGEVPVAARNVVVRDSRVARWTWLTRLTPAEQVRIRDGTAKVATALYDEGDWDPANAPAPMG